MKRLTLTLILLLTTIIPIKAQNSYDCEIISVAKSPIMEVLRAVK